VSNRFKIVVALVLRLPYNLFDGMNKALWIFRSDNHIPLSVVTPYYYGTVPVQARGEHHTGPQKNIKARIHAPAPVGPRNVIDEKGQQAGLDRDLPVRSDVDLSGKDSHVRYHDENETPAQDPDRRGILVLLLALHVEQYYGH